MDSQEEIAKQFGELNQKFEKLKGKSVHKFSIESLAEFCRGFDSPILGSLAYLKQNTLTHRLINCSTKCPQLVEHIITNEDSYYEFANDLNNVSPPVAVDFVFSLCDSIYPIGDVSETFSVYFRNSDYQIVYTYGDNQEFRLTKQYMSHIEPNETRELRDLISKSIIAKASQKIDSLL